jgi:hypothetical protein
MISSYLSLLPEVAVFAFCLYYFSAKKTVDGLLLSIGSGIGLFLGFLYRILPMLGNELMMPVSDVYKYTGVVGFVSSTCFAIGFGMLITELVKPVKK